MLCPCLQPYEDGDNRVDQKAASNPGRRWQGQCGCRQYSATEGVIIGCNGAGLASVLAMVNQLSWPADAIRYPTEIVLSVTKHRDDDDTRLKPSLREFNEKPS